MFLKRLEVIGFKSFADRIGIDFVPGVTAVVGPNGSGKSNVTDAIRWVLGEQSAKSLRGSKMEDVIFAGSDSRKPLNFAEVTLTLNNEDEQIAVPYTEISVTRRVYRSGDSEYLLNNQSCRLKDITDLFMDSGLGKEAFSIISQGRVDEVLNSKPNDRRVIFEEAAGVLKYKIRKKKAEHKLVETDENLHRVLDILHELDQRLEPLKIQASAAKDYVQMTEELKQFDISLTVHDVNALEEQLAKLQTQMTELSMKERAQFKEIDEREQAMRTMRTRLEELDRQLQQSQEQLVEATAEVERWDGRKALALEKSSNAKKQLEQLQERLLVTQNQLAQLETEERDKKEAFSQKQQDATRLKQEIKQLEHTLNRSVKEMEDELERTKNRYIDLLNEEATHKNELKHVEQQLAMQQANAEKMTDRSLEMVEQLTALQKQKAQLERELLTVQQQLQEKLSTYNKLTTNVKQVANVLEEKQTMLFQAYQHIHQLQAKKDTLSELEQDFSGFFQGVREVLQARQKGQLNGIEGAVAELVQVEGKYAQAIETALGAAMQHIVTSDEAAAQRAIRWLKEKRVGRATFLPKTVMKSRVLDAHVVASVRHHPQFVRLAYELVTYEECNRTIIENVLGNVLVAENLKGASEIARLVGYKFRVVTLDGDIVNAGGSLTGGAAKQQSSVFSRKAELEQLTTKLAQLEATTQQAERSVAQDKENLQQMQQQLEEWKQVGDQLRQQEQKLQSQQFEIDVQIKTLSSSVKLAESEQSTFESRESQLHMTKRQLQEKLAQIGQELSQLNETVEQLTAAKAHSETEKDVLRDQLGEKRSILAVIQEQITQTQTATASIALQIAKVNEQIQKIAQEIKWFEDGNGHGHHSIEDIEKEMADWLTKRQVAESQIAAARAQKEQLQQEVLTLEDDLKEQQRIHKNYVDAINTVTIQQNRAQVELGNLLTYLEEDYYLDIEQARKTAAVLEDIASVRRKVKLLKQSIEELGPVNLTAIEEYDRVEERHSFLTEQRNDLLAAKDTLHHAITEMDEEMTIRFKETFMKVREQFQLVFRELFGGGNADLLLLQPDHLLETGIEIIAQPPGKKAQNLSLLSGGERALTAIALLFAILNTRPVPFCILDEVEAALDEANVLRYSRYLNKFSAHTQFIVITHRKGTMEGADVLYGITMQESGVSKLVSVKLEEAVNE